MEIVLESVGAKARICRFLNHLRRIWVNEVVFYSARSSHLFWTQMGMEDGVKRMAKYPLVVTFQSGACFDCAFSWNACDFHLANVLYRLPATDYAIYFVKHRDCDDHVFVAGTNYDFGLVVASRKMNGSRREVLIDVRSRPWAYDALYPPSATFVSACPGLPLPLPRPMSPMPASFSCGLPFGHPTYPSFPHYLPSVSA